MRHNAYYKELAYLQSTGTQYIDTGLYLNNNYSVELDYQYTTAPGAGERTGLFGTLTFQTDPVKNPRYGDLVSPTTNKLEYGYGINNAYYQTTAPDTNRHLIKHDKNKLYVDGTLVNTFSTDSFSCNTTAYLCNFNYTNYVPPKAKYYSAKFWDGSTLVRDFVPILDFNNTACWYDRVNNVNYYNAGTGSFSYGFREKPIELAYIETNGTQYFDSGIKGSSDIKVEISFYNPNNFEAVYTPMLLFGSRDSTAGITNSFTIVANVSNTFNSRFDYYNSGYSRATPGISIGDHIFIKDKEKNYIDGTEVSSNTTASFINDYNMYIFTSNTAGNVSSLFSGRLYYCKIWDDGTLVRDFIPVLDLNKTPCLYDKVSDTFFYNAGTGELKYSYKDYLCELEYLESSGTQYIDTEIYLEGDGYKFEFKYNKETIEQTTAFGYQALGNAGGANYQIALVGYIANITGHTGEDIFWNGSYTSGPNRRKNDLVPYGLVEGYVGAKNNVLTYQFNGNNPQTYSIDSNITPQGNTTVWLFANPREQIGGGHQEATMKFYYWKLYKDTTLIADFIPVLDWDNIPCMYDRVSQRCFYNGGTGQFKYSKKGYYCEVEYLESNGNQYIDTGVNADSNLGIEYTYLTPTITNEALRFGAMWYDGTTVKRHHTSMLGHMEGDASGNAYFVGKSNYIAKCNLDTTTAHTYRLDALTQKSYIDGVECAMHSDTSYESFDCEMSYWLFGRNCNDTSLITYASLRIYNFKMYNGSILVRDFIPVLDWDMVPCLYDKVTNTRYYNQGTVAFTYGRKIYPVEYLEGSPTNTANGPYINTGINYFADFELTAKQRESASMKGCGCDQTHCVERENATTNVWCFRTDESVMFTTDLLVTDKHSLKWKNNEVFGDGVKLGNFTKTAVSKNFLIFAVNATGTVPINRYPLLVYGCKMWNPSNGELIRDYIPAIDENGVGFLFDKVSHTIYDNLGTGDFAYGGLLKNKGVASSMARKLALMMSSYRKSGYTPLKYLENDANSWIVFDGIFPNQDSNIEMAVKVKTWGYTDTSNKNSTNICGCGQSTAVDGYSLAVSENTSINTCRRGGVGVITPMEGELNKQYVLYSSNDIVSWNGEKGAFQGTPASVTAQTNPLTIFRNPLSQWVGTMQISSFRVWNKSTGEIILDAVPVLDTAGIPCMWDRAHDKLYYNKGSGSFTYGEWDYTRVDYIRTDGNAYINTYCYGNLYTSTMITARNSNTATNVNGILLGARDSATANNISTFCPSSGRQVLNDFGDYTATRQSQQISSITAKFTSYNSRDQRYVVDEDTGIKTTVTTSYSTYFTTSRPIYIAYKSPGYDVSSMINFQGDIFSCGISFKYGNNVHLRRFHPVVDENSVGGLYDELLNIIFYSIGSTEFEGHFVENGVDYKVVKHIESTGTQYIDTGVKVKSSLKCQIEAKYSSRGSTVIGAYDGSNAYVAVFGNSITNIQFFWRPTSVAHSNMAVDVPFDSWVDIELESNKLTANGVYSTWSDVTSPSFDTNLTLFGRLQNGVLYGSSIPIKYAQIWDGTTLVRDFIPVLRESNNEAGMFDAVNRQFCGNAGTGTFNYEEV